MHHQAINDTVNGSGGGDAETERKHGREGEAGIPAAARHEGNLLAAEKLY